MFFNDDNTTCLDCVAGFYLFEGKCYKVRQSTGKFSFNTYQFTYYKDVWGNFYVQRKDNSAWLNPSYISFPLKIDKYGALYIELDSFKRLYFSGAAEGQYAYKVDNVWYFNSRPSFMSDPTIRYFYD